MTTMLEKMRRAIWEADSHPGAGITAEEAEAFAIAALKALREPTKEMVDVGNDFILTPNIWEAMIDEALAEDRIGKASLSPQPSPLPYGE